MNNLVEFMGNSGLWMAFLGSAIGRPGRLRICNRSCIAGQAATG